MPARRRRTSFQLLTILIVLAGSSLLGCGDSSNDSKLLSSTSATELRSSLETVEEMVEIGNCGAAEAQVTVLEEQVISLRRVEADLKDALESSVSRLGQLVVDDCKPPTAETGPTGPAETGGATGPDEQQSDEEGNGKKKDKEKKKDQSGDEGAGQGDDESGGSGEEGSTGSGGFAP